MTDKQIIIDASKCEWRTGVEHCGNYECMLNKCCDYNCDWYKRRKLEQQLQAKEQECEELKKENFKGQIMDKEFIENPVEAYEKLKQECERLKAGYAELTEIVSPFMDDFTGYNEELGGFDIVLCVKQLREQLDQLKAENRELKAVHSTNVSLSDELFKYKAENEELKETIDGLLKIQYALAERCNKYSQTLTEIKPILEFYANSKMGEEQPDRTYKIMLSGSYIMVYDPKPARQALQKITECEVTNG